MKTRYRNAFTLIEVLIVVVIMAVLAGDDHPAIFPRPQRTRRESAVKFNANTMRSQIELYKAHHLGKYPTLADFAAQLTECTNAGRQCKRISDPRRRSSVWTVHGVRFRPIRSTGSTPLWRGRARRAPVRAGSTMRIRGVFGRDHNGYSGGTSGTTTL